MQRTSVVVHPAGDPGIAALLGALPGVDVVRPTSARDVRDALSRAAVLVTPRVGWSADLLVPGLRWVQSQSAGFEGFPLAEFRRRNVVLSTGRGLHVAAAEHAVGLLLALLRDLHVAVRDTAARRWNPHMADELGGRTVAVVGLGTIGEGIARRLSGWDVTLIGVTRSPERYRGTVRDVRPLAALGSACAEASVLMLAVPLTAQTTRLVGAAELDALGPGWLVNVSRGPVVDEAAAVERLRDGRLRGAGLDVAEVEPPPRHSPLWALPTVLLSPHMAGRTPNHGARFAELFAHNLEAFRGGSPWRNRIC